MPWLPRHLTVFRRSSHTCTVQRSPGSVHRQAAPPVPSFLPRSFHGRFLQSPRRSEGAVPDVPPDLPGFLHGWQRLPDAVHRTLLPAGYPCFLPASLPHMRDSHKRSHSFPAPHPGTDPGFVFPVLLTVPSPDRLFSKTPTDSQGPQETGRYCQNTPCRPPASGHIPVPLICLRPGQNAPPGQPVPYPPVPLFQINSFFNILCFFFYLLIKCTLFTRILHHQSFSKANSGAMLFPRHFSTLLS